MKELFDNFYYKMSETKSVLKKYSTLVKFK